jgi:hypothetical protein
MLIKVTAERIRHVSRIISVIAPQQVIRNLRAVLCLATVNQAVLTLMPAPTLLIDASGYVGFGTTLAIAWPAAMSLGVAYFGANALAAQQALVRVG